MSRATRDSSWSGGRRVLAALARAGSGGWSLVIAERSGSGPDALAGGAWTILESRSLAEGDLASVPAACQERGVSLLVRIAPTDKSLVRCVRVPSGSDDELATALSLMAEAELPQTAPVWRRSGGLCPGLPGNGERWALLTGWMGEDPVPALSENFNEVWITSLAALAALREDHPLAAYADASTGAIAVIAGGHAEDKLVARVTREDAEHADEWSRAVTIAVEEALLAAKLDSRLATQASGSRALILGEGAASIRRRVQGVRDDAAWLDAFGIAVGAILVAGSDLASVRSLAGLRGSAPIIRKSSVERAAEWVSVPRHAWTVIAASVAALLLSPLALTWARGEVLSSKAAVLEKTKGGREEAERRAALYQQLSRDRLPMVKLLADVSKASPVGVVGTSVRFVAESPQTFNLQGVAESLELVNTLTANLAASGVFRKVQAERVETKAGVGVEFTISGEIASPFLAKASGEDFAAKPLAVRLYGDGASNTAVAAPAGTSSKSGGKGESNRRGGGDGERRGPSTAAAEGPPAALSDADIAKLDRGKAMTEWAQRKAYVQKNPSLDSATKERLNSEVEKLQARRNALKDQGGSK